MRFILKIENRDPGKYPGRAPRGLHHGPVASSVAQLGVAYWRIGAPAMAAVVRVTLIVATKSAAAPRRM
jgi:hypothetical protein